MSRRRRGLVLVGISLVLALLGATALSRYVAAVDRRVGPLTPVLRLRHEVAVNQPLAPTDVEVALVPEQWAPPRALADGSEVLGKVAATALGSGAILTADVLAPPPALEPGQREIAILVDAETGVAGRIEVGSRVDIVATFAAEEDRAPRSEVVVAGVEILAVGDLRIDEDDAAAGRSVPVTFALSTREALVLTYAESFAVRVRLAAVGPPGDDTVPPDERTFTLPDGPTDPAPGGATP